MSTTVNTPASGPAQHPSGRHPVNVGHLVMGIAFLGLVGVWALLQGDVVDSGDVRWLLPMPWVLAGLGGLLAIALSSSKKWATRRTGWVGADPETIADPDITDITGSSGSGNAGSSEEETR